MIRVAKRIVWVSFLAVVCAVLLFLLLRTSSHEDTLDFVVIGDSQGIFAPIWPVASDFDDILFLINDTDVDMVFHVGDMYAGDSTFDLGIKRQADDFLSDVEKLEVPMHPVMGNHDSRGDGWEVTREKVFQGMNTFYSIDRGNAHFIVLDAFMPGYEYILSQEQLAWLENDLRMANRTHIFLFVHAPLYPLGPHLGDSLDKFPELRDRLAELLVEHRVDVVFCGHEHFYASFGYKGLMQVTSGGAGASLRSPVDFDELIGQYSYDIEEITRYRVYRKHHFVYVSTDSERIEIAAYDLEGNVIDEFTLE